MTVSTRFRVTAATLFALAVAAPATALAATHPKQPAITSFSPGAGKAMTKIVVVGRNFAGVKSVKVDGRIAKFTVDTAKKLTVTIPAKAKSGKIAVVTSHGTATSAHALKIRA